MNPEKSPFFNKTTKEYEWFKSKEVEIRPAKLDKVFSIIIHLKHDPYVGNNDEDHKNFILWMTENIQHGWASWISFDEKYDEFKNCYAFTDEIDAMAFKLRWE